MIMVSLFICIFWTDMMGAAQVIHRSIQVITAGRNVTLHCQLVEKHDVIQITWQKQRGQTKTNVATYSEAHGSQVLGKYQSKVYLLQSGLTVAAITFHPVTLEDKGCYNCIFNTFPLGSIIGKTCLKVYILTNLRVNARYITDPNNRGSKVLEINCSANGIPDPLVSWKATKHFSIKPKEYAIQHPNETVTIVSSFTHIFKKDTRKIPIICVIQHPSLTTAQELVLPELGADGNPNKNQGTIITATVGLLVLFLLILLIYSWKILSSINKKQDLPC